MSILKKLFGRRESPQVDTIEKLSSQKSASLRSGESAVQSTPAIPTKSSNQNTVFDPATVESTFISGSTEDVGRFLGHLTDINTILVPAVGYTALHLAVESGDAEKLRLVLRRNPDLEIHSLNQKFTPLHVAVTNGKADAVEALLEAGADIKATATDGLQSIHLAAMRGRDQVVISLLKYGANVHTKDIVNGTALHAAAYYGFTPVVQALLEAGANPHSRDNYGNTPLQLARDKGRTSILSLMEKSTNVQTPKLPGNKELFDAVENGQTDFIENAISSGQKLSYVVLDSSHNLLHAAALNGHADLVPILIKAGVSKNQNESLMGETPLHMAVRNNHIDVAKALLESGADINARNANQWTPLHDAAYDGNIPMIELLVKFGADINAKENMENTPTSIAVSMDQMTAATLLRGLGGKTNIWKTN